MKDLQKYFLAILPPGELMEEVQALKLKLKEEFGTKFALKSPAHITLKMPFVYDQNRLERLEESLKGFLVNHSGFEIGIKGVSHFRKKVVFLKVEAPEALFHLQKELKTHLRRNLHLVEELSDKNYHPHMTVAYQDLKKGSFDDLRKRVEEGSISSKFHVGGICVLRKDESIWRPLLELGMG